MNETVYTYLACENDRGMRLDVFLAGKCPSLSRAQIKKYADSGMIFINDKPARAGRLLKLGDSVSMAAPPLMEAEAEPEDIPLNIVYEDSSVIVVDKPPGMVVHPAAGNYCGTLVNALLFHCRDLSGIGGVMRPGIVHRLDKGTSGLLVAAKNDEAHRALAGQFKNHEVKKTYLALVHGNVRQNEGAVDMPVGRDAKDRKKMSAFSRRGKEARSLWRVMERYGAATLLEVNIETGRTHQIRVHLAFIGHPIVGDRTYGGGRGVKSIADHAIQGEIKRMERPALHAEKLLFIHPATGASMSFTAPMPEDMTSLCNALRQHTQMTVS